MAKNNFKGFPPRENSQSYTGIPNIYFDKEMRNMSSGERDIMQVLFRKTYGWVKEIVDGVSTYKREDEVSQTQFMEHLDLSRNTVKSHLKSLQQKGYIIKVRNYDAKTQRAATYAINIEGDSTPLSKSDRGEDDNDDPYQNLTEPLSKSDREALSKSDSTKETSFKETKDNNNSNTFSKSDFQKIKSTYEELIGRKFTKRLSNKFYELSSDVNDILTALERCHDYNINTKGGPPNKYIYKTINTIAEKEDKTSGSSNDEFSDWDEDYDDQLIELIKKTYNSYFEEDIDFIYLDELARKECSSEEIIDAISNASEKYYEYIDSLVDFENKKTPYEFILDELKDATIV